MPRLLPRTLLLLGAATQLHAQHPLTPRITATLAARESALIAFRHDLHQHPELSGQEERTAGLVAARLRGLGFTVRTGVGGHGVVALLTGGKPGPVVAFRADMDAVPSTDPDPAPYRSLVPGVRHICGHDIHTTLGLALAEAFAAVRMELPGKLLLIFQPAEERASGAAAMLQDSLFSLARPAAIYAVHTAPLEVGRIGSEPGPFFAGRDRVAITLTGDSGLAAAVDSARGLISATATITLAQAREALAPGFVLAEVGPVAGTGRERVVWGTLSIADPAARGRTRARLERAVRALARPGLTATLRYEARAIPGVLNDSLMVVHADARLRALLGDSAVVRTGVVPPLFSEDFGAYDRVAPTAMYLLGVSNRARGWVGMPHTAGYMADDAAIVLGARAMAEVLLGRLSGG